jgi:hypothetical protein
MLADIFLTRLQNLVRLPASSDPTLKARDPRFVPVKLPRK